KDRHRCARRCDHRSSAEALARERDKATDNTNVEEAGACRVKQPSRSAWLHERRPGAFARRRGLSPEAGAADTKKLLAQRDIRCIEFVDGLALPVIEPGRGERDEKEKRDRQC